jgi:hypothetical protein
MAERGRHRDGAKVDGEPTFTLMGRDKGVAKPPG